jgi:hypothetical protein
MAKRCANVVARITDDRLVNYANADLIQLGGEIEGICVEPVRREQLGADRDDFR